MSISIGDVVVLKGGSPKMTVTDSGYDEGAVQCTWFVGDQEAKREIFKVEALVKIKQ